MEDILVPTTIITTIMEDNPNRRLFFMPIKPHSSGYSLMRHVKFFFL